MQIGVAVEPLEPRTLLSAAGPVVDISRTMGNESEGAIAVDPTNPQRLFAFSNQDALGLFAAVSSDGGATWSTRTIADGSADDLRAACCDPSAAFDGFGNLFIAYLDDSTNAVNVAISTDGGQSFAQLARFKGDVDQPTIATGPGSVWVTFAQKNTIRATGAAVTGLNAVGDFGTLAKLASSRGANFGDIAVGSDGRVMVTYQTDSTGGRNAKIRVNVDPDGLGPRSFGGGITVTSTNVGQTDKILAQHRRSIDAEAALAFDRSGGPFNGRAYLVYTDEIPVRSDNTDIFLRYSDTGGATWSAPIRLNDDTGLNSQFLPRLAIDQTTGQFAVTWHDSRNDLGNFGAGDTDGIANDDAQVYGVLGAPTTGGVMLSPNFVVSSGVSNAHDAHNEIDYGDYTGLAFDGGIIQPIWADNSNSNGDNPDGNLAGLDLMTRALDTSTDVAAPTIAASGGTGSGPTAIFSTPLATGSRVVTKRSSFTFTLAFSDAAAAIDSTSIDSQDVLVTGPNGFSCLATFVGLKRSSVGGVSATYRVDAPLGTWRRSENGTYSLSLVAGQVSDLLGSTDAGGSVGSFVLRTRRT